MASLMGIRAIDCLKEKRYNRLVVRQHGEITDVDIEEGLAMTKTITEDIIKNAARLR
jgi:6-phosphofructokinase 1